MALRYDQLPARLEKGLSPVYLFAGPEPLLVQEARDAVRAVAAREGFTEREVLHADAAFDWERLAAVSATPSLFAERRIIDLRLPTGKPGREGGKALTEWAESPDPDTLLIVSCEEWDTSSRKSKWAGVLERAGTRVDIWPVKGGQLPRWISSRMQAAGLEPDREAVQMLADLVEGNLLAANQEIQKLTLLKGGGPVTASDVRESVADSSRFDAFELAERMLAGDADDGLRVSAGLKRTGVPLQMITGALYHELRQLEALQAALSAGEDEGRAFRRLRIWGPRQGYMRSAARRIDERALSAGLRQLAVFDRQGKGQQRGDPWHTLDELVCTMCGTRLR